MLFENTLYINLDEREDRRLHVVGELAKIGITAPERIPAIKITNPALGCSLSHLKCLNTAKARNWKTVFICEDDIAFLHPQLLLENVEKFSAEYPAEKAAFDVLIIGGNNAPPFRKMTDYCIQIYNCQTTTGYVVASHYYDTLIENITDGIDLYVKNLGDKNLYAIDIYWKILQKRRDSHWYMIIPATVIQYENYSDIENMQTNYSQLMLDVEKSWMLRQR